MYTLESYPNYMVEEDYKHQIFRSFVYKGSIGCIGSWSITAPDPSPQSIEWLCKMIRLKLDRYVRYAMRWGNIVVDAVCGSNEYTITMEDWAKLYQALHFASKTKNITSFVSYRQYDESVYDRDVDNSVVLTLMFEKYLEPNIAICNTCPRSALSAKPNEELRVMWSTINEPNDRVDCGDDWFDIVCGIDNYLPKIGETFTLDKKEEPPYSGDIDKYYITVPRYPFTFRLLDKTIEWILDEFDGDGLMKINGEIEQYEIFTGYDVGPGVYKYEHNCLIQIK